MARNKGTFKTSANYEVKIAEPLDPREQVDELSDLYKKETWPHDGDTVYLYNGLRVYVKSLGDYYILTDKDNYTNETSWNRQTSSSKSLNELEKEGDYVCKYFVTQNSDGTFNVHIDNDAYTVPQMWLINRAAGLGTRINLSIQVYSPFYISASGCATIDTTNLFTGVTYEQHVYSMDGVTDSRHISPLLYMCDFCAYIKNAGLTHYIAKIDKSNILYYRISTEVEYINIETLYYLKNNKFLIRGKKYCIIDYNPLNVIGTSITYKGYNSNYVKTPLIYVEALDSDTLSSDAYYVTEYKNRKLSKPLKCKIDINNDLLSAYIPNIDDYYKRDQYAVVGYPIKENLSLSEYTFSIQLSIDIFNPFYKRYAVVGHVYANYFDITRNKKGVYKDPDFTIISEDFEDFKDMCYSSGIPMFISYLEDDRGNKAPIDFIMLYRNGKPIIDGNNNIIEEFDVDNPIVIRGNNNYVSKGCKNITIEGDNNVIGRNCSYLIIKASDCNIGDNYQNYNNKLIQYTNPTVLPSYSLYNSNSLHYIRVIPYMLGPKFIQYYYDNSNDGGELMIHIEIDLGYMLENLLDDGEVRGIDDREILNPIIHIVDTTWDIDDDFYLINNADAGGESSIKNKKGRFILHLTYSCADYVNHRAGVDTDAADAMFEIDTPMNIYFNDEDVALPYLYISNN